MRGHIHRLYARVAGWAYLANYLTSVFGVVMIGRIAGSGEFPERAARVLASEPLYRTALVSVTIGWILIVCLAFCLYVTLEPVNRRLAQLALCMELGQAFVGAVTVMSSFTGLTFYAATAVEGAGRSSDLASLAAAAQAAADGGFQISMMFLGVGSTIFFYLFFRSGYIPRVLAAGGAVASILLFLVSITVVILPRDEQTLLIGWAPMGLAEVGTALWLMIRGINNNEQVPE